MMTRDLTSVTNSLNETEELQVVGESLLLEIDSYMKSNRQRYETMKNEYHEVNKIRLKIQEDAKRSLQALLDDNEKLENKSSKEAEMSELLKQERQLLQEQKSVKQNFQELSDHCKSLKEQHEHLNKEKKQLEDEKERLSNETAINLPKKREELSLYNSISRIRWDFEGPQHHVKGYISNKNDVKPFSFDERKCSQYFITNSLWDSMEES
ncbi:kinetochore-associated Ndc80 complex subunit spc24 [Mactra antiquata]